MAEKIYDLVIYGASGFTGQYVIEEMAKVVDTKYKWAVAGRSEEKLRKALANAGKYADKDLSEIPMEIADVSDVSSLEQLAAKSKIILNCVGPYRNYGEPVVKACVENGSSHVDVSGEPIYLEGMQLKYHEQAKESNVYVVGACGFDSIPFEMGIAFMRQNFPGELNSVEGVVEPKPAPGYCINYGTFASMINGFANQKELKPIRSQLMPHRPPKNAYPIPPKNILFKDEMTKSWCLPFLGSDKSVAARTVYYNYHNSQTKPLLPQCSVKLPSLLWAILAVMWGILFGIMASFGITRKLLEQYPEMFSFGMFSKQGPTREQVESSSFSYWLRGRGWATKTQTLEEQHHEKPPEQIICRVDGPDPGYVSTAAFLVASALTILEEKDKLPHSGGVYPPGAAFQDTGLIHRLGKRDISFTVLDCSIPKAEE